MSLCSLSCDDQGKKALCRTVRLRQLWRRSCRAATCLSLPTWSTTRCCRMSMHSWERCYHFTNPQGASTRMMLTSRLWSLTTPRSWTTHLLVLGGENKSKMAEGFGCPIPLNNSCIIFPLSWHGSINACSCIALSILLSFCSTLNCNCRTKPGLKQCGCRPGSA